MSQGAPAALFRGRSAAFRLQKRERWDERCYLLVSQPYPALRQPEGCAPMPPWSWQEGVRERQATIKRVAGVSQGCSTRVAQVLRSCIALVYLLYRSYTPLVSLPFLHHPLPPAGTLSRPHRCFTLYRHCSAPKGYTCRPGISTRSSCFRPPLTLAWGSPHSPAALRPQRRKSALRFPNPRLILFSPRRSEAGCVFCGFFVDDYL